MCNCVKLSRKGIAEVNITHENAKECGFPTTHALGKPEVVFYFIT